MSLRRIFPVLVLLAVFMLRGPVWFRSVLDWDESLYVLMAGQWLAGHLPYTVIWDNKPVGIYAIFALFRVVASADVPAMRLATSVFAAATALTVWRLTLLTVPGRPGLAMFAGTAFVIGSLSNDGLAANTELFMACFTTLAMLAALSPGFCAARPLWRGFVVGLLFGLAFMTKYVAVFEAPAVAWAVLVFRREGRWPVRLAAVAGGAVPLLAVVILYAATGHLQLWWDDSIAANFRRAATPVTTGALVYAFDTQLTRWLPFYLASLFLLATAVPIGLRRNFNDAGRLHLFLCLWLLGGALGVASAKSFYDHYFLQILPVLCVTLAWSLARLPAPRHAWAVGVLMLAFPAYAAYGALADATRPILAFGPGGPRLHRDTPAQIAADLPQGATLYVFDSQPIIYALAGAQLPTKFVLPSILTGCSLARVAGVDPLAELRRILASAPQFIIRRPIPGSDPLNTHIYAMLNQTLTANYTPWKPYDTATVYRRRQTQAMVAASTPLPASPCPQGAAK